MPIMAFMMRIFRLYPFWRDSFAWVAYISLGFFSLLFAFLVIFDFFRFIKKIVDSIKNTLIESKTGMSTSPADVTHLSRRRFISNSINSVFLIFSGIMTIGGIFRARQKPQLEKIRIPIRKFSGGSFEFRIVQISDIHLGPTIKGDFLKRIVDSVNMLDADMVVITGDLVDGTVDELRKDVLPLTDLKSKFGTFFITGNHEYYSGVQPWVRELEGMGITVLLNEHRIIQVNKRKLLVAGVTDYSAERIVKDHKSDPAKAIMGAPECDARILLAHQPRSIFKAAELGFDLMISGHTHGGQYFPWNFFVGLQQPYVKGLHKHGKTWVYVNRGTGYWGPPVRLGVPSEITEILLV